MSYARILETGYYIYPDIDNNVVFTSGEQISNDEIDVFLYRLFTNRKEEFNKRLENGKRVIEEHAKELERNDYYEKEKYYEED